MPTGLLKAIKEILNPEEFSTLSDFIRRAIEHYIKELSRKKLTEECLHSKPLKALYYNNAFSLCLFNYLRSGKVSN